MPVSNAIRALVTRREPKRTQRIKLNIYHYSQTDARMLAAGYEYGAPRSAEPIDRAIAETTKCAACRGYLEYVPFIRRRNESGQSVDYRFASAGYRAFAVCRTCDAALEF